jgi:hypothetical protein
MPSEKTLSAARESECGGACSYGGYALYVTNALRIGADDTMPE